MRVDCAQKGIANPRFKASGLQIRWNGGLELVELYSSSSISEVGIKDFSGSRLEINVSGSILGLSVGGTGVVARHTNELGQRTGGITLGIGVTVAYDAVPPIIPIKVNGNVNYGATRIANPLERVKQFISKIQELMNFFDKIFSKLYRYEGLCIALMPIQKSLP